MGYIDYRIIASRLDMQRGDVLYLMTDISRLAYECMLAGDTFQPDVFINTLQKAVGNTGTLLVPTYNWDFCNGIAYDHYKTSCKTGVLGKVALTMSDFKRTKHPIYSFAVWGEASEMLATMDNVSSFGSDSPFGYIDSAGAKAFALGIAPNRAFTYLHYIEQNMGVPYREHKDFTADYTDAQGNTSRKTYSMYVRNLALNPQHNHAGQDWLADTLRNLGALKTNIYNNVEFHTFPVRALDAIYKIELEYNGAKNLYTFDNVANNNATT
ncbi:hypothetical protein RsTz2092_03310 [Deferribacterales bacterium RsTz2092]|nr:hypothetical protein AGMMS49941_09780 [Deferribacterales bacterium]